KSSRTSGLPRLGPSPRPLRECGAHAAPARPVGDLLETAGLYVSEGHVLDEATAQLLADCVDRVAILWPDEDAGKWELEEHRHHTASKIAVWMAFDRALRLAEEGHLPDEHVAQWREQHDRLHAWIEASCWSDELGAYRGWAGEESL